jgi:hypothetical protein
LLAKLQEKWGPQQNPQIQLIKEYPHGEDPRVVVITRGGTCYRRRQNDPRKNYRRIRSQESYEEKTQTFDAKKEKKMFEEARREFRGDQGSSSKT